MTSVDPVVLVGRGLAWKEAWEEDLTDQQRRLVRGAVMRGRKLDDVSLTPYLAGFLARQRRSLRWMMVLWLLPLAAWLFVGVTAKTTVGHWFGFGLATLEFVGGGVAFWLRWTWLARSERLNLFAPARTQRSPAS